jgi:hypothetical protein
VVEGDGVDGAKVVEVVLERGVVAVPGHDVEGGGGEGGLEELAAEFVDLCVKEKGGGGSVGWLVGCGGWAWVEWRRGLGVMHMYV